jgi:tetratricopeptide (TPR) repeat protein
MNRRLRRECVLSEANRFSPAFVTLLVVVAGGLLVLGWIGRLATSNPTIRFLTRIGGADWIVYPLVPDPFAHDAIEMVTVFRRSWWMDSVPTSAGLRVRAFTGCRITLNTAQVGTVPHPGGNWKTVTEYDVTGLLRPGTNVISVAVSNSGGPPALWLLLKSGQWTLKSDQTWECSLCGAVWQPARLASTPMPIRPGNRLASRERCAEAFRERLPTLLLFAGLSLGILFGAQYLNRKRARAIASGGTALSPSPTTIFGVGAAGLWIALFAHNLRLLPAPNGFDVMGHLAYIEYIRQHHALPLANEGWEMHHPPLYYLLCAWILSVLDVGTKDPVASVALRLFGLTLGLAQLGLILASLRLVFPNDARKQTAGLIFAAFLPSTLYLYQYVTNEILAATLATASVYCCLRIFNRAQSGIDSIRTEVGLHAALGLCLGGALLSKVSACAVAPVILGTLAGRLLVRRERDVAKWLSTIGLTVLLCIAVCGWHYVRVWAHFGRFLVGNFDRASGFAWWQDPGYGTAAYFTRFGRSLVAPLFSGVQAFGDGLHSTLWGDGLCGGMTRQSFRPPWNYDLMTAGYWLAVLPSIAIIVGLIAAIGRVIGRRQATWCLLAGVAVSMMTGMVFNQLKLPYYASAKAFYGLPALTAVCVFGAWGMDLLTRRSRAALIILWTLLGTWAMNSYASLWIRARAPYTRILVGREQQMRRNFNAAICGFQEVLQSDPRNPMARLALAETLQEMGETRAAQEQYQTAWTDNPRDPDCIVALAYARAQKGQAREAVSLLQQAIQDAPDRPDVYPLLGSLLAQQNQFDQAVAAYEAALRITPGDADAHSDLGLLVAMQSRYGSAIDHFSYVMRIHPDDAAAQKNLAWVLAGVDPAAGGDPAQAVALAEQACNSTSNHLVAYLDTLAAAYAAASRYDEAVATAQKAVKLALAAGQTPSAKEIETRLALYRARRPYRLPDLSR